MTDLGTLLVIDAVQEKKMGTAKNALKKGATIEFVADITGLDKPTVRRLRSELETE